MKLAESGSLSGVLRRKQTLEAMAIIPGISDHDLERLHWNYGHGRGALGLRHLPSGILVACECQPSVLLLQIMQRLEIELKVKLQEVGVIPTKGESPGIPKN